jgi:tripartite-type tricarboxylate transporter receptor subunit TctC
VINRLNAALRALVSTDEVKQRIGAEGRDPLISSPAEYDADIDREATKWAASSRASA